MSNVAGENLVKGAGVGICADQLRAHLMRMPAAASARGPRLESAGRAVTRIPVVTEGLLDVRRAVPSLLILPAPCWSDPELRFFVRPDLAARLRQATEVLPSDVRLGFWEGLRPLPIQKALWDTGLEFLRTTQPELDRAGLEAALERLIARPHGAPPHSTGSAVDVAPVDAFGRPLGPADAWGRLAVRAVARALSSAGLANYEPEWWHWSYGDEEWARAYDCAPLESSSAPEFDGPGGGI